MEEKICEYVGLINEYIIVIKLLFLRFEDFLLMLVKIVCFRPSTVPNSGGHNTYRLDSTKTCKSVEEMKRCLLLKKGSIPLT